MLSKTCELQENILKLPVRRNVYNLVKDNAGIHLREVERRSRLSLGVVKYHLDYLSHRNLIKQEKAGSNVRYFPIALSDGEKRILKALRPKSYRHILLCLIVKSPVTQKEIASFVNLSQSTVSWHLNRLLKENILAMLEEKGKKLYSLQIEKEKIIKILISYRESFLDSVVDNVLEMWNP